MKLPRRNFLHLAAGAAALSAVSRIAWAQAYQSRSVRSSSSALPPVAEPTSPLASSVIADARPASTSRTDVAYWHKAADCRDA